MTCHARHLSVYNEPVTQYGPPCAEEPDFWKFSHETCSEATHAPAARTNGDFVADKLLRVFLVWFSPKELGLLVYAALGLDGGDDLQAKLEKLSHPREDIFPTVIERLLCGGTRVDRGVLIVTKFVRKK